MDRKASRKAAELSMKKKRGGGGEREGEENENVCGEMPHNMT